MKLPGSLGHLTYCTNIHPGESWPDVRANLERHVLPVKALVRPDDPFGVGLRIGGPAAAALARPAELAELKAFLAANDLYVFTLNGFPHGSFHGTAVKEQVYRPDWLEEARVRYTVELAEILAQLLPEGSDLEGSISTVPGAWAPRAQTRDDATRMADAMHRVAARLVEIEHRTGRRIALALEPEPGCFLETTPEAAMFVHAFVRGGGGAERFAALAGVSTADAELLLRRHIAVCLDACHAAVEFESLDESLAELDRLGVRIAKVQLSAGLVVDQWDARTRAALESFANPVYLHQVVSRAGDVFQHFDDLGPALDAARQHPREHEEWRVHFHVPIFREALGPFRSTQPWLSALLARHVERPLTAHLEVETYTFGVLPEVYRTQTVDEAIARELLWVEERLGA
jgi:sugar phosphate isomerase/epimerase